MKTWDPSDNNQGKAGSLSLPLGPLIWPPISSPAATAGRRRACGTDGGTARHGAPNITFIASGAGCWSQSMSTPSMTQSTSVMSGKAGRPSASTTSAYLSLLISLKPALTASAWLVAPVKSVLWCGTPSPRHTRGTALSTARARPRRRLSRRDKDKQQEEQRQLQLQLGLRQGLDNDAFELDPPKSPWRYPFQRQPRLQPPRVAAFRRTDSQDSASSTASSVRVSFSNLPPPQRQSSLLRQHQEQLLLQQQQQQQQQPTPPQQPPPQPLGPQPRRPSDQEQQEVKIPHHPALRRSTAGLEGQHREVSMW